MMSKTAVHAKIGAPKSKEKLIKLIKILVFSTLLSIVLCYGDYLISCRERSILK